MAEYSSTRPYLIRALYEWMGDNGLTPHVVVDAAQPGVTVPPQAVRDGRVVLNLSSQATHRLELGNDWLRFRARFGGRDERVEIPIPAVIAIFARENGQGMSFPELEAVSGSSASDEDAPMDDEPPDPERPPPRGRPHLKVVK